MEKKARSYHQYCPVAHTLDVVGDRWALLIVRNLLVGPKRFVDLRTSLRGIVTNILTDRLRELEAAGLIQRRYLPPPAASTVYELTSEGAQLEPVLAAMAVWGGRNLGVPQAEQTISAESVCWALIHLFQPLAESPTVAAITVVWDDPAFNAEYAADCSGARVQLTPGAPDAADLRLHLDVTTVFALASGQRTLADALASGAATLAAPADLRARLGAV